MPGLADKAAARGHVGTRTNPASITLQRNLISTTCWGCPEHLLATINWHWLRLACSGWPAGFHSMCWSSKRRVSSWMLISVSVVGHTLSAFPSGKRVQFHANTCTPGEESWIQFSSWLVTSEVPLVLEWYGHTSLWVWSPWRHYFVLSGAYILALQVNCI